MTASFSFPPIEEFRRDAASESIMRLGLLTAQATDTICTLLLDAETGQHPKAVCTAYRKAGAQVDDEVKAKIGLRKNGFLSKQAYGEISELGLRNPLDAHYLTLLRANFALGRYRRVRAGLSAKKKAPHLSVVFRFDVFHQDSCDYCVARDTHVVGEDFGLLPPKNCNCITAPYDIRADIDYLSQPYRSNEDQPQSFNKTEVKSKIWSFFKK